MTGLMQAMARGPRQSICKSRLQAHLKGSQCAEKLGAFLSFNGRQVLVVAGKVSHKQSVAHAQSEYEQFATQRRAALEAEGESYAVRILCSASADAETFNKLGKVAKRLAKKKGGRDAA